MAVAEMAVEVVYARADTQVVVVLKLPRGATVHEAIAASGLRERFPEIGAAPATGIFGERVTLDEALNDGDRVEIYRALIADPKQARRQRAARRRAGR
jgi:hypothetical protein